MKLYSNVLTQQYLNFIFFGALSFNNIISKNVFNIS